MSPVLSILPSAGVEFLRCGTCVSGYRNVYEHGKDVFGRTRYVAKVKSGGRLITLPDGRSSQPHLSAAAVVAWYQARFGDNWKAALRKRKCNPMKVWYSKSRQGWLAAVWLWGYREEVRLVTKGGKVPRDAEPIAHCTRTEAKRACFAYAKRREGLFWQIAMWRS